MIRGVARALYKLVALALAVPTPMIAQWSTSTLTQNALYVCPGFSPSIITFNDGSSIIAGGLTNDIYLGKLDERGYRIWPQPVLAHHNDSTDSPGGARLIPDGSSGAILVWGDHRGSTPPGPNGYYNNALYIQRVDGTGIVRWQTGGIQLAPAYTGLKGAFPVTDGAGGGLFIVLETDFDHPGAANIERLWGARYDSNGTLLWRRVYDSSTVQNSISLSNVVRVRDRVFIQTFGGTFAVDLDGNRLNIAMPLGGAIVSDRDSTLFWATSISQRDTINDTIYVYVRITKYSSLLDTIWSLQVRLLLDGEYSTGIFQRMVPDARGGVFYVKSTYDDNNFLRTRVYHVDSLGNSIWSVGHVYYPGLRTRAAFHDGSGGIVLLLGNTYDLASRHDYSGRSLWPDAPITTISDPGNIGVTGGAGGDNRGGAIVPFWSFSGGIKAIHTGRNGVVGIITAIDPQRSEPVSFDLKQNYPNPFNPSTTIVYEITKTERVDLKVFDILGQEVATLVDELGHPGIHEVLWNGSGVASGVYYYRLKTESGGVVVRKMLLVR
jgi:hypothetical protein